LKNILKKVQENQHPKKIEVNQITEKDDLSLMGIDSLDMIAFRFSLDEAFGIDIPDEDFEEKQLTNIENLLA
jgi:acyl carrier protein